MVKKTYIFVSVTTTMLPQIDEGKKMASQSGERKREKDREL